MIQQLYLYTVLFVKMTSWSFHVLSIAMLTLLVGGVISDTGFYTSNGGRNAHSIRVNGPASADANTQRIRAIRDLDSTLTGRDLDNLVQASIHQVLNAFKFNLGNDEVRVYHNQEAKSIIATVADYRIVCVEGMESGCDLQYIGEIHPESITAQRNALSGGISGGNRTVGNNNRTIGNNNRTINGGNNTNSGGIDPHKPNCTLGNCINTCGQISNATKAMKAALVPLVLFGILFFIAGLVLTGVSVAYDFFLFPISVLWILPMIIDLSLGWTWHDKHFKSKGALMDKAFSHLNASEQAFIEQVMGNFGNTTKEQRQQRIAALEKMCPTEMQDAEAAYKKLEPALNFAVVSRDVFTVGFDMLIMPYAAWANLIEGLKGIF